MANYCVPEKGKAALLCISAQRDFVSPGSPVRACGWHSALPNITRLVESFRAQHAPIFHSVRLYQAHASNVDARHRQAVEEGLPFLIPGILATELINDINAHTDVPLAPDSLFSREFHTIAPTQNANRERSLPGHR